MTRAVSRRNPASVALKLPRRIRNSARQPGKSPKKSNFCTCAGKIVQKDIVYIRTIAGFEHFATARLSTIRFAGNVALGNVVAFGQQFCRLLIADVLCAMTGLCFPPASDQNPSPI
jgi:hypothetical protein